MRMRAAVRVLATGLATYPDVTTVCGDLERDPESATTVVSPSVVVEVLSDGTEAYDRGQKLDHYRQVATLAAVVLVSHHATEIEVSARGPDGQWRHRTYGTGTPCPSPRPAQASAESVSTEEER